MVSDDDFTATSPITGELRHYESQWYPARADDGSIIGVAVLVSDVTERHRSEQALLRSNDRTVRLQQATAALGRGPDRRRRTPGAARPRPVRGLRHPHRDRAGARRAGPRRAALAAGARRRAGRRASSRCPWWCPADASAPCDSPGATPSGRRGPGLPRAPWPASARSPSSGPGSTSASGPPRWLCSAACCRTGCPTRPGSSWPRASCPARPTRMWAATGTTRSRCPTGGWCSSSATSWARGSAPRRAWAGCGRRCAPSPWSTRCPRRC